MTKAKDAVVLIGSNDLFFQQRSSTDGLAEMAWLHPVSKERGVHAGFVRWDKAKAPAKILDYDEYLLVLEGEFGVELTDGSQLNAKPGEVIFIAAGTTVRYQGTEAKVFYAISTPSTDLGARKLASVAAATESIGAGQ